VKATKVVVGKHNPEIAGSIPAPATKISLVEARLAGQYTKQIRVVAFSMHICFNLMQNEEKSF